ncbi:hypothetical protein PR048_017038 [Dryococelus australis]|uniref:Small ribosomal subunit protein uS15m n=1 Tax=Dryococelus australis TaxID=614101 RepID=A0ABQ9H8Z6_9NEOP|nr:hypothetical protein PR048_017038 [Dryococelus australis]
MVDPCDPCLWAVRRGELASPCDFLELTREEEKMSERPCGLRNLKISKGYISIKSPAYISATLLKSSNSIDFTVPVAIFVDSTMYFSFNFLSLAVADELVKRMFTLSFLPRKYTVETEKSNMIDRVRRHQLDRNSVEKMIAEMTANIRNWQELFEKNPQDKVFKVNLKELIEKRRKYLKFLRSYDYKRFEWLLEELNLRYRPHPRQYLKVTRKASLRNLTNKYCEDLKQKRLDEYKAFLEAQKLSFLQGKLEKLQQIQKDEQELDLSQTVTDEDIDEVRVRIQKLVNANSSAVNNISS